jgi:hypothetical protein
MSYRPLPLSFTLLSMCLFLAGCPAIFNHGGERPEGMSMDYEFLGVPSHVFCGSFQEGALIIRNEQDINEVLNSCSDGAEELENTLLSALEGLDESATLVFVSVARGGCVQGHDLPMVALDGDVLRPWLLKDSSAYGRENPACPADLGEALELLAVWDIEDATTIELTVGIWNSDLPGSPYEEHQLSPQ